MSDGLQTIFNTFSDLRVAHDTNAALYPVCTAMRDLGADAGADVPPQGLRSVPSRLPQDDALPEMAENGGSSRYCGRAWDTGVGEGPPLGLRLSLGLGFLCV